MINKVMHQRHSEMTRGTSMFDSICVKSSRCVRKSSIEGKENFSPLGKQYVLLDWPEDSNRIMKSTQGIQVVESTGTHSSKANPIFDAIYDEARSFK